MAIQGSLGPGVQKLSEEEIDQEIFHFLSEYRQCIHAEEGNVTMRLNVDSLVDSLKSSVNVKNQISYFRSVLAVYHAVLKWYSERMSIPVDAGNAMQDGSYFPALHGALRKRRRSERPWISTSSTLAFPGRQTWWRQPIVQRMRFANISRALTYRHVDGEDRRIEVNFVAHSQLYS